MPLSGDSPRQPVLGLTLRVAPAVSARGWEQAAFSGVLETPSKLDPMSPDSFGLWPWGGKLRLQVSKGSRKSPGSDTTPARN